MKTKKIVIPEISDKILAERMKRIKFVIPAMYGIDGKPYLTEEKNKNLFDFIYHESTVNPRTCAFNFDDQAKLTGKADDLVELLTTDIYIKVGGYYGFLKMTMAEVLSQIPEEILDHVVAFALNPAKNTQVIASGEYQIASIIFFGKSKEAPVVKKLPSSKNLLKEVDMKRAVKFKDKVRPIINYINEGYTFIDPGYIDRPFMDIGIWLRINGSNLHRTNTEIKIEISCKTSEKIFVYAPFTDGADFYKPTYAQVISQIPDTVINEKTIGFLYGSTNYFKTQDGVIHQTDYTLIEKK